MGCPRDPGFGPETLKLSADFGQFGLQGGSEAGQTTLLTTSVYLHVTVDDDGLYLSHLHSWFVEVCFLAQILAAQ